MGSTTIMNQTWVMGDLVLLQSEVGPVIQKLQESNFQITGFHNHLINETPRVMYVHDMGGTRSNWLRQLT